MPEKLLITNQIRKLRFFAGEMTQQQLADLTGASRQTIVAVEAGKYAPSLELAFRIADAFGVSVTEVFTHTRQEAKA
jgi:putative transcriptional regulator